MPSNADDKKRAMDQKKQEKKREKKRAIPKIDATDKKRAIPTQRSKT